MGNFLTPIIKSFIDVLMPLRDSLSDKEQFEVFLVRYGWDLSIGRSDMAGINAAFAIEPLVRAVLDRSDRLVNGSDAEKAKASLELVYELKATLDHIGKLNTTGGVLPLSLNQATFWSEIAENLIADLLATYFEKRQPVIYGLFHFFGIIRYEKINPSGTNRIPYNKTILDFGRLGDFFTAPHELLKKDYKWNREGEDFDHNKLFKVLERVLLSFRIPAAVKPPDEVLATRFLDLGQIKAQNIHELQIPVIEGNAPSDNAYWKIGAILLPIPDPVQTSGMVNGIVIMPLLQGELSFQTYFSRDLFLKLSGAFNTEKGVYILLHPDKASFETSLGEAEIKATIELIGNPETPWTIIGAPGSHRFEIGGFKVLLGLAGEINNPEILFTVGTGDTGTNRNPRMSLVIQASEGDGFIGRMVGTEPIKVDFAANLIWSSIRGFSFEGQVGFEVALAIHLALGPLEISTLYVALRGGNIGGRPSAKAELGIGIKLNIGPLTAIVENIGVRLNLSPVTSPDKKGLLGDNDLEFGFKPPNGVGLSLDAGVVRGGGYLYFDFDREEYAGALELTFSNFLSLKAIGLITTKMPDGSKGFSLLIIITVEFGTGLQLGFGFTLLGVGGLLGLNRSSNGEALIAGIRAGSVANIMFPRDVVANAPRIISDLRAFFPAEEGKFLIGPMGKLGWGTPTLVSVSLGVIVEFSTQGSFSVQSLTILGVLKIALPTEEAALLVLQVQFLGRIEFDKRRAYFFASLYDSRILFMTIEGEMGLLIDWSDNPNFVLSVGGFHPSFTPPPMPFPVPRRIAVELSNNPYYRVRVENYFAVTSNTVQFGARAELEFRIGDAFQINGHIAFDALFQFSPFYFIIGVSASVSLRLFGMGVFSIRLEFELSGPTPWRARGTGYISFLFFEFSANFDVTWGDSADTTLEPITVLPLLRDELKKEQNWTARLPEGANIQVSLRKLEGASETLVLHPLGSLLITQRAIPLKITLDKVGHQKPADFKKFKLNVNAPGLTISDASEKFAIAQFQDMNDAEKLSRPAFQPEPGGVALSGDANGGYKTTWAARRFVRYENIVIDTRYRRYQTKFFEWIGGLFSHFLVGSAVTQSALSLHQHKRLEPFVDKIDITPPLFTVANMLDNTPLNAAARSFTSEAAAREFMVAEIGRDANLRESIHVIPNFEANF